jgi:hypothetical protein
MSFYKSNPFIICTLHKLTFRFLTLFNSAVLFLKALVHPAYHVAMSSHLGPHLR